VIGTGRKTSVNDIYKTIVDISGLEAPVERGPRRPGDARDAQFDSTRAAMELGWTPQTPLRDGIKATYDYFERMLAIRGA
jgi:nucleoside-diphosphate-sugar epimerase